MSSLDSLPSSHKGGSSSPLSGSPSSTSRKRKVSYEYIDLTDDLDETPTIHSSSNSNSNSSSNSGSNSGSSLSASSSISSHTNTNTNTNTTSPTNGNLNSNRTSPPKTASASATTTITTATATFANSGTSTIDTLFRQHKQSTYSPPSTYHQHVYNHNKENIISTIKSLTTPRPTSPIDLTTSTHTNTITSTNTNTNTNITSKPFPPISSLTSLPTPATHTQTPTLTPIATNLPPSTLQQKQHVTPPSSLGPYTLPRPIRPLPMSMTWSSCSYMYLAPTLSTCAELDCPANQSDSDAHSTSSSPSHRPVRRRPLRITNCDPFGRPFHHKPKPRYKVSDLATRLTHQNASQSPAFPLKLREDRVKGKGVYTLSSIVAGDFVCEYGGELIGRREAEEREEFYSQQDPPPGCYMFYFSHANKHWCIDSTIPLEVYGVGRYINHSRTRNNLSTIRVTDHAGIPHLCFVASTDIAADTELLFDYGDRANADHFTWLNE